MINHKRIIKLIKHWKIKFPKDSIDSHAYSMMELLIEDLKGLIESDEE